VASLWDHEGPACRPRDCEQSGSAWAAPNAAVIHLDMDPPPKHRTDVQHLAALGALRVEGTLLECRHGEADLRASFRRRGPSPLIGQPMRSTHCERHAGASNGFPKSSVMRGDLAVAELRDPDVADRRAVAVVDRALDDQVEVLPSEP
jgi:hypothetical protein